MLISLMLALAGAGLSNAAPGLSRRMLEAVEPRQKLVCNADNALRALRATQRSAEATPFCRQYIGIDPVTVTAAIVTPTTDVASTTTLDTTTIETLFTVATNVETVVLDSTTTITTVVTSTAQPPQVTVKKREVAVPGFMSQYPASRISSACSCLSLQPLTTAVTFTVPTVTVINVETAIEVATAQVTETSQTTLTSTQTNPPSTQTVTETTTFTPVPEAPRFYYIKLGGQSAYAGFYLKSWKNEFESTMVLVQSKAAATIVQRRPDGLLSFNYGGQDLVSFANPGPSSLHYFAAPEALTECDWNCPLTKFKIDESQRLLGDNLPSNFERHWFCPRNGEMAWYLAKPTVYMDTLCSGTELLVEEVIPFQ